MGLAAGFIYSKYGPVWGIINATVTVSLGTVGGSLLGFWSCRKLFKGWFQEKVNQSPTLHAFMSIIESHGFKLVLIMRMAPIPFGVQNGLFSISNISGLSFSLATFIGVFPEIVMLVYMGTTMRDLSEIASGDFKLDTTQKIMLGLEIGMSVLLCALLFYLSRKAMKKVKEKEREHALRINTGLEDLEEPSSLLEENSMSLGEFHDRQSFLDDTNNQSETTTKNTTTSSIAELGVDSHPHHQSDEFIYGERSGNSFMMRPLSARSTTNSSSASSAVNNSGSALAGTSSPSSLPLSSNITLSLPVSTTTASPIPTIRTKKAHEDLIEKEKEEEGQSQMICGDRKSVV